MRKQFDFQVNKLTMVQKSFVLVLHPVSSFCHCHDTQTMCWSLMDVSWWAILALISCQQVLIPEVGHLYVICKWLLIKLYMKTWIIYEVNVTKIVFYFYIFYLIFHLGGSTSLSNFCSLPGSLRVLHSILAVLRTVFFWTQISEIGPGFWVEASLPVWGLQHWVLRWPLGLQIFWLYNKLFFLC